MTMRSEPVRDVLLAGHQPRSSLTTSIWAKPSSAIRSCMAYGRAWLSRLCRTWHAEDCRAESTALRAQCCGPIASALIGTSSPDVPHVLLRRAIGVSDEQARREASGGMLCRRRQGAPGGRRGGRH